MSWEHFEHTADLGLRVRAAGLDELFADAGRGLFAMIVEDLDAVAPRMSVSIAIEGTEPSCLLHDWLGELLAVFDTRGLLLAAFDVRVTPAGLEATASGETTDRQRHHLLHEVKAITYHGLRVEQETDGWVAEVIVDI